MKFLLAATTATVALAPAGAQAFGTGPEAGMQTIYNADGSGTLFANGENTAWERCAPDLSACESAGTTRQISTGDAPAGTVFRLAGTPTGPVWHGNLAALTAPAVKGVLAAGELVTPVPATWQGGWEGSYDGTQLAACATPTGKGCVSITDAKYLDACPGGGAVLDPSFAGRYLQVADVRLGPGSVDTLEGHLSPYGQPVWTAQGNVAVAMVGRIGPATHPLTQGCGAKPLPEAWISSRGVAKVVCAFGCEATLIARHAGRTVRATLQVPATGLPSIISSPKEPKPSGSTLAVASGALKRLGGGKTSFALEVGGQVFARKSVVLKKHAKRHHKHRRHQR